MSSYPAAEEDQRRKQVKFRAPAGLVTRYDDVIDGSRADSLRDHMREVVGDGDDGDDLAPYEMPDDAGTRQAYRILADVCTTRGVVRGERAKRAIASVVPHAAKGDSYAILKRLENAGYVYLEHQLPGVGRGRMTVYVRPWSLQGGGDGGD